MSRLGFLAAACLLVCAGVLFFVYAIPRFSPPSISLQDPLIGNVFVSSLDLLVLESFPVQVNAVVKGHLADPCSMIDEVFSTQADTTFLLTIRTVKPTDAHCHLDSKPFEEIISLDVTNLPAGTYQVSLHDHTQSFTLTTDNLLPSPPLDSTN